MCLILLQLLQFFTTVFFLKLCRYKKECTCKLLSPSFSSSSARLILSFSTVLSKSAARFSNFSAWEVVFAISCSCTANFRSCSRSFVWLSSSLKRASFTYKFRVCILVFRIQKELVCEKSQHEILSFTVDSAGGKTPKCYLQIFFIGSDIFQLLISKDTFQVTFYAIPIYVSKALKQFSNIHLFFEVLYSFITSAFVSFQFLSVFIDFGTLICDIVQLFVRLSLYLSGGV